MRRDILRNRILEGKVEQDQTRTIDYKLRQLRRAAVDAEKLTSSQEWNAYLQQVAALNEADTSALEGLRTSSDNGLFMSAEECQKTEFERALLRAKIQARNECIEVPNKILQGSSAARDK